MRAITEQGRVATPDEQAALARWSSWGAVPSIFDESREEHAAERAELRSLLTDDEYSAARRSTVNAHYTDPAYVAAMWKALADLGFAGGRVLEPGCGSGTFIGLAPAGAQLTGVELDPITARIAAALYPQADIRSESFADTRYPAGFFDAAIGNVPFADVRLHDPRYNPGHHALHNHFILKALELTRPGGMVAVLTSSFTMDAQNPAARREMHAAADLVGAVRLPSGAHRRTAGTEVVTDLLILRRRQPGEPPGSDDWVRTEQVRLGTDNVDTGDGGTEIARVNSCFLRHPDRVLGRMAVEHGMYGASTLVVRADDPAETGRRLTGALDDLVSRARTAGDVFTAPPVDMRPRAAAHVPDNRHWAGHITAHPGGEFTILGVDGGADELPVPGTQRSELRALLGMRDLARDLLAGEAASRDDTPHLDHLRTRLAASYRAYVATYGPINRFTTTISANQLDPESGNPLLTRRTPPVMQILRRDPFGPLVRALESYDDVAGVATPASILAERVVQPRTPILGADTAADALAVTLESRGRVDLADIARLRGLTELEAREELGTLVFQDPANGDLVPAVEYLSGNVRVKLQQAEEAAPSRPDLQVNVAALREVQPADLRPDEIEPRIAAAWISADDHRQFLADLLRDPTARVEHPGGTVWAVRANTWSLQATSEWGTQRRPAGVILHNLLEQRPIEVYDTDPDGKRILNATDTEAAREKAGAMQERFAEWVWEDPDRALRLAGEYNHRFNALVLRDYTTEGENLALPGLARTFTPRPHQRAAAARMISEPAVGLFHQVGAGKTAEMVMGVMELRRLGMASKPVVVVPNHMLEQFSREWLQLYPQARVLAASSDDLKVSKTRDKRREFVARTAANDWDAVVMTREAFERIPVSRDAKAAYMEHEIADQRAMLERAKQADGGLTVKRMEKAVMAAEERLKALLDGPADAGLSFEATGIDYLVIDEAHDYKNLATTSNIAGAAIAGAKRSSDLHMKAELLRSTHGHRVITVATATPIANSVTEAHVMQRYLRPDLLRDAGVADFDSWAATFGQTVTEMEMAPAGGGSFRQKTRFAKFQNVPEMLRMWQSFADVRTADDLNLPTPALAERPDGLRRPEMVVIPPSEEVLAYVRDIGRRVEIIAGRGVEPDVDNMLKISTDGRKAALDMRLVQPSSRPDYSKVTVAADRIARIYHDTKNNRYRDSATGQTHPTPGALQLVFCDLSTPKNDGRWTVYQELKEQLVDRGVPAEGIRFIHDARNDLDKGRLFAAARAGHVSVLLGSTQKMGVGTNVQARAVALHHLDCPWRPADLEQRDGRILRQGNQNPVVQVVRYCVEQSFDAHSWQTVERKARFIAQVMRGRIDVREMEDVGDNTLSFAEAKALASGDPLVLDKATADAELARLERLSRAHQRNLSAVSYQVQQADRQVDRCDTDLAALEQAGSRTVSTGGSDFRASIAGTTTIDRADAADLLRNWAAANLTAYGPAVTRDHSHGVIAHLGGHDITATEVSCARGQRPDIHLSLAHVPRSTWAVTHDAMTGQTIGVVRQMENHAADVPGLAPRVRQERAAAEQVAADGRAALQRPFKYAAETAAAREKVREINTIVAGRRAAQVRASVDGSEPSPGLTERISALHDAADDLTASMTTNPSAAIPVHGLAQSRVQSVSGSPGPQVTL